ncbi:hypothetical protein I3760_13G109400 [Carya illinoinensis]|nr:hypothetical protein I3760_13G109400 [Carya illinoinensis]
MANLVLALLPLFLIINILSLPLPAPAVSSCNGPCKSLNNCTGQLICIEDNKCQPSDTKNGKGKSFSHFKCSPPVTSSCEPFSQTMISAKVGMARWVVALSTGWFDGGSRYGKMIKITASNGRSVKAKVVDECDSPSCKNNIIDGSNAVWNDLGLNIDDGVGPVTWSLA